MGYRDTIDYLYGLQKHGIKLGLETPRELLREFGDPHRAFRSVHVAGTNGKGSTAAAAASMLRAAGYRVGLFTSPHLVSFTERISVDAVPVPEEEVVALAEEIRGRTRDMNPTFFEVVTVMGFLYFKRQGVDWAVVETGLGGRLDATNVLTPAVSIITSLGFDHREFLGETLEEIAGEKAGIIKKDVPAVTVSHSTRIMNVIEVAAAGRNAALSVCGRDFDYSVKGHDHGSVRFDYFSRSLTIPGITLPLSGTYQAQNASLAIRAFEIISGTDDIERVVRKGLSSLSWPGRLQKIADGPPVYVDGAHNPNAAAVLAETLKADFLKDGKRLVLVMGIMADKDIGGIMGPLLSLASEIIFAAPAYGRAASADALAETASKLGFRGKRAASVREALDMGRAAAKREGTMVLVTGSFFTIGEAMEAMGAKGFLTTLREWQAPN